MPPIDADDLEPLKPKMQPPSLDRMSIEELEAYIGQLAAEIERVKAKIAAKKSHRSAASGIFGPAKS
jgi:uncharacterized small protein (DUF1192 family)